RFDAAWLDEVAPDRPVVLRTMDHHTAWGNSAALRRARIAASFPDPFDGQILRRADGSALGTLREFGALNPVLDLIPPANMDETLARLSELSERFAAAGITWVQDAWVEHESVDPWLTAADRG